ncbi:DMT family transporter [Kaistia dalseonensis]|uniref:Drug/metabolite transporter (DMT)-like permease n=1 Tax=Kaistia dalseonensis TaxID=410840 RepID=A0ABU0HB02_9HYPH|nr:DMT family transporter [Kaistia dalseonensis]MCX5496866.1 DMT family transporter [Kaistia dalseonensis]MDQ0439492.1 drug/metabolite transporter (DMT)-like permease [Kaistia dalseonensis]
MSASPSAAEAAQRLRGILIYCSSMLIFSSLDTSAKFASTALPALEVSWMRFVVHALLAIAILRPWRHWNLYKTKRPVLQIARSLVLAGSTIFNFMALRELQLDETAAIGFSGPFFIAGLAGPFLGEWAGPRRWMAIFIGFIGVLIVTAPGVGTFKPAIFLALSAALSYAFFILSTRLLTATESMQSLLLYAAAIPALALAPLAIPEAIMPPTIPIGVALLMMGVFGILAHWCVIRAHTLAPAPVLAPFMYIQMVWAILLGYLVFGNLPEPRTLVGAGVIVVSGIYLLYREHLRAPDRPPSTIDGA